MNSAIFPNPAASRDSHITATDGYGQQLFEIRIENVPLEPGWSLVMRCRAEDGEHIFVIRDAKGRLFRWLEDEGGPEWQYRQLVLAEASDRAVEA